jgi:large-conductance mechanosensitive channel
MLTNADLIILTASVYLGGVLGEFFKSLSADLILPLLSPVTAAGKGVSDFTVRLGSIELRVGELLSKFVSLVISLFLVVTTVGLLKTYVLPAVGGKKTMS